MNGFLGKSLFDLAAHDAGLEKLETGWNTNYRDPADARLGGLPEHIANDTSPCLWSSEMSVGDAYAEGREYRGKYYTDVQFVQDRAQHHWHRRARDGWEPLAACKRKGTKVCKAEYSLLKRITTRQHVVCPGVAKKFGLRVSGRRNALGPVIGKRGGPWFPPTAPALSAVSARIQTRSRTAAPRSRRRPTTTPSAHARVPKSQARSRSLVQPPEVHKSRPLAITRATQLKCSRSEGTNCNSPLQASTS